MTTIERYRREPRERVQTMRGASIRRHEMRAELRAAEKRGEIAGAWGWREEDGVITVNVLRLRDPIPRWKKVTAIVSVALLAWTGILAAAWQARHVLLAGAAAVAVVAVVAGLASLVTGRTGGCACILHDRCRH